MTGGPQAVAEWVRGHARPLDDVDVALRSIVGDAVVVGLGVPTHGTHELTSAVQRLLEPLVERLGFRALALDEGPEATARLDHHLRTGDGDPRALIDHLGPHHRTEEVLALLGWLRTWNERHPADPVRLVGAGPSGDEPDAGDPIAHAERRIAENTIRDHDETAGKVAFWSGLTHTAVGDARTVSRGSLGPATHRNAGSRLHEHFGERYVSICLTFGHGDVASDQGPVPVPPPAPGFVEAVLATAAPDPAPYLLDLRGEHPEPVEDWLRAPAKLRLVGPWYDPADDPSFHMTGGSLADWFDAVAYVDRVTPTRSPMAP